VGGGASLRGGSGGAVLFPFFFARAGEALFAAFFWALFVALFVAFFWALFGAATFFFSTR